MALSTYLRRKAQGVCYLCTQPVSGAHVYCETCLEDQRRAHYARSHPHTAYAPWAVPPPPKVIPLCGPVVGHCGQFWPIEQIPWCCPECRTTVLREVL